VKRKAGNRKTNNPTAQAVRTVKNGEKGNGVSRTGLYWPEKKTEVDRVRLPFQTVETINEPNVNGGNGSLLTQRKQTEPAWRNRLIWGDNKYIMASLLPEFAGKINLIYIDPPFASDRKYNFRYKMRLDGSEWDKKETIIEELVYRDTWGKGLDSYLQMMYDRLVLMRELLVDNGSIYVHLDWHVGHYLKVLMDEVFGKKNFRNEIVWQRDSAGKGAKGTSKQWSRENDFLLLFSKNEKMYYKQVYRKDLTETQLREYMYEEPDGRKYKKVQLGDYSEESIEKLRKANLIHVTSSGREYKKYYLDEAKFAIGSNWTDIINLSKGQKEQLGFPTQKPEALIERIIKASSKEGDLVADFFCGSGTTGAMAERLGRRWIMADLSKFAIHTTRKRLLDISGCKPFEVQNLGRYQKAKMRENGVGRYVDFVLKLYRAESISGYSTLHGKKAGRLVHIGHVDSIVTEREIRDTLKECASDGIRSVDFLGWDFEMGLHDLVDRIGDEYSVKVRLVQIPREATEVKDADKEDIKFFDLNCLELEQKLNGKALTIALKDFEISNPEYLPQEVKEKTRKFTDFIDYWAVDFDFNHGGFHNTWQSFRTRRHPALEPHAHFAYKKAGNYQVLVKVVDIFGNDTNKLLNIRFPNGKH